MLTTMPRSMRRVIWGVLVAALIAACAQAGAFYRMIGVLSVAPEAVTLNLPDGRIFTLEIDPGRAKAFDGKLVELEGVAPQADQVGRLRVKSLKETAIDPSKVVLPEYHIRQRQPRVVRQTADTIEIADTRWGFRLDEKREIAEYFWKTARIKPDLVDQVYFLRKPFAPEWIAAHSCLVFTFKPGGCVSADGKPSQGLLLSVEAHLTTDQKYDLKDGFFKKFGIIWLLITWEDYAAEACDARSRGSGKLYLYPAQLTHDQRVKLLRETIAQSTFPRTGEFYHTTRNNCTNTLVMLFNHVLAKKIKLWAIPGLVYNLKATMPIWVPEYLQKRGVLGEMLPEINVKNYFLTLEEIIRAGQSGGKTAGAAGTRLPSP